MAGKFTNDNHSHYQLSAHKARGEARFNAAARVFFAALSLDLTKAAASLIVIQKYRQTGRPCLWIVASF
jgi:hypothetical protein